MANASKTKPAEIDQEEIMWTPIGFATLVLGEELNWWQDQVLTWYEDSRGPVKGSLATPNGAGKSSKIVAILALWWLALHKKGRVVITTKDGKQLSNQIWPALNAHSAKFLAWSFLKSEKKVENGEGGYIVGFTTDEPGNAEGWHRFDDGTDGPLLIIVDEAKSVQENIFTALDRCSFNALLYASSPGLKIGSFYKSNTDPKLGFKRLHVGLKDCPHIPQSRIDNVLAKYGPDHPFTRSTLHGEFMDEDEDTSFIVPPSAVRKLMESLPRFRTGPKTAFCDFAAGGAENVLALLDGNHAKIERAWRERDTMKAVGEFILQFIKLGLHASEIYGDNTGVGRGMIDRMYELGWEINRVDNADKPTDEAQYANLGSEIWFEGSRALQTGDYILDDDEILHAQLTTRKIVTDSSGRLMAYPKKKMQEDGLPSPDRADAILGVLAKSSVLSSAYFEDEGLRALELMSQSVTAETAALDETNGKVAYVAHSPNGWITTWERPLYGCAYLIVVNPPPPDEPMGDFVAHAYRDAYYDERQKTQQKLKLVSRLRLPCRIDATPFADMVRKLAMWYGYPMVVPVVNDRGDVIDALRKAGVMMNVRQDYERHKRGKQSNVVEYGWESTDYTRSMWLGELSDAVREKRIEIMDSLVVRQIRQLTPSTAKVMREAESVGVALKNMTLAAKHIPASNSPKSTDYPGVGTQYKGWADKGGRNHAIS